MRRSIVAACLLGSIATAGCSSATKQKIEQAAGIDTLSRSKQPNGTTRLVLDSNYWEVAFTLEASGHAEVSAAYTDLTTAKATGSLACNDGTLTGTITSNLSDTRRKTLHVQGITMDPHSFVESDSDLCNEDALAIDTTKEARTATKVMFGEHAFLVSDSAN